MDTIAVYNPFTNKKITDCSLTEKSEAKDLLQAAYNLHKVSPAGLPKAERKQILQRFMTLFLANKSTIINTSIAEGGKPLKDTVIEFERAIEGIQLAIHGIDKINGEQIPMELNAASINKTAFTTKSPIGVVLSISAFNHPINLTIHQVLPAIAAGCPVIYKPALSTPLVSKIIIDLLHQAGLPKGWCTYLLCSNQTTALLAKSELLGYISFIGSAKVGWSLRQNIAAGVNISLEHGGNAPVLVCEDADLKKAIPELVKASFYHAGQVCVSAQRIYVHEHMFTEFKEGFIKQAKRLKTGDPQLETTDVGPIITEDALARIKEWIELAEREGAEIVLKPQITNTCLSPTVVANPASESFVTKEEIFGPVVCLYSYSNEDAAIKNANNSPYIFQSAAYTQNINIAFQLSKKLNGAAVMINQHPAFRVDWMPFGGQGLSGQGLGGIDYSINEMLKQKLIVIAH